MSNQHTEIGETTTNGLKMTHQQYFHCFDHVLNAVCFTSKVINSFHIKRAKRSKVRIEKECEDVDQYIHPRL